jgi:hypothetical protein
MNSLSLDFPDTIQVFLEPHLGRNAQTDAEALERELSSPEVPLQVQENFPFAQVEQQLVTAIVIKIGSAAALTVYKTQIEPRLLQFGKVLRAKYFKAGREVPPPKPPEELDASGQPTPPPDASATPPDAPAS